MFLLLKLTIPIYTFPETNTITMQNWKGILFFSKAYKFNKKIKEGNWDLESSVPKPEIPLLGRL